jgi:hypothetical protein
MNTIKQHLKRYPKARTSTLARIQKQEETTRQIKRSLPFWKRVKLFLKGVR